jgi:hypothetical protein
MNRKAGRTTLGNTRRALKTAWQHHQAGRLHEAGKFYRQVLEAEPRNADALGLLGMIALQLGDSEIAADLLCRPSFFSRPISSPIVISATPTSIRTARPTPRRVTAARSPSRATMPTCTTVWQLRCGSKGVWTKPNEAIGKRWSMGRHLPPAYTTTSESCTCFRVGHTRAPPNTAGRWRSIRGWHRRIAISGASYIASAKPMRRSRCHAALAAKSAQARGHNTLGHTAVAVMRRCALRPARCHLSRARR